MFLLRESLSLVPCSICPGSPWQRPCPPPRVTRERYASYWNTFLFSNIDTYLLFEQRLGFTASSLLHHGSLTLGPGLTPVRASRSPGCCCRGPLHRAPLTRGPLRLGRPSWFASWFPPWFEAGEFFRGRAARVWVGAALFRFLRFWRSFSSPEKQIKMWNSIIFFVLYK